MRYEGHEVGQLMSRKGCVGDDCSDGRTTPVGETKFARKKEPDESSGQTTILGRVYLRWRRLPRGRNSVLLRMEVLL